MACHDGSDESQNALNSVKHGLLRNMDSLVVAHAWSKKKEEYLTYKFKKEWVREQQSNDFLYLGNKFKFHESEIHDSETAKSVLAKEAIECKATLTIVGMHGRKGPKADPTVMGSAVQYMALNCPTPMLLIKEYFTDETRPNGIMMACCIDGSKKSLESLALMVQMRHAKDKIYIIICEQQNIHSSLVKSQVEEQLEMDSCLEHAEVKILKSEFGKKTKDIIRDHLNSIKEIDIVFVGNKGADFSGTKYDFLGSVANEVIRHTKFNCVFIP